MKEQEWSLLAQYVADELTEEERKEAEEWLAQSPENRELAQDATLLWERAAQMPVRRSTDMDAKIEAMNRRIDQIERRAQMGVSKGEQAEETLSIQRQSKKRLGTTQLAYRVAVAATFLIAVVGMGLFLFNHQEPTGSMLTMSKTAPAGSAMTVDLPDGSTVVLSPGATLKYPETFGMERHVELSGQAFFDVSKDPERRFVIAGGATRTEVLGTSFTLRAVPGEPEVQLTVETGRVRFSSGERHMEVTPGQQAVYTQDNGQIRKYTLDGEEGTLDFDHATLGDVFDKLGKHYEVTFQVEDKSIYELRFDGKLSKNDLEKALKFIDKVNKLRFDVEGERVTVSRR